MIGGEGEENLDQEGNRQRNLGDKGILFQERKNEGMLKAKEIKLEGERFSN